MPYRYKQTGRGNISVICKITCPKSKSNRKKKKKKSYSLDTENEKYPKSCEWDYEQWNNVCLIKDSDRELVHLCCYFICNYIKKQ